MKGKKPPGGKQRWQPGHKVSIGGREYIVKHQETEAPPGEAKAWVIATADGSRVYRWRPFRGLQLVSGGELVRPRRRRKPEAVEATPAAPRNGLLTFLLEDLVEHPRQDAKEYLAKVLGFFGMDKGTSQQAE